MTWGADGESMGNIDDKSPKANLRAFVGISLKC